MYGELEWYRGKKYRRKKSLRLGTVPARTKQQPKTRKRAPPPGLCLTSIASCHSVFFNGFNNSLRWDGLPIVDLSAELTKFGGHQNDMHVKVSDTRFRRGMESEQERFVVCRVMLQMKVICEILARCEDLFHHGVKLVHFVWGMRLKRSSDGRGTSFHGYFQPSSDLIYGLGLAPEVTEMGHHFLDNRSIIQGDSIVN
jgi:hypothetical protein